MTDARVMAFKTSLRCLETASDIRVEFRKQHPDPETTPLPSDFWGFVAFGQVYATLAGAADTAGWLVGLEQDEEMARERKREQANAEHVFRKFADKPTDVPTEEGDSR